MEFYPPSMAMLPDKYVLVNMYGKLIILAGWHGGYINGSSWRRSTEIVKVEESTNGKAEYIAHTRSGSQYILMKDSYGFTSYTSSIYESMISNLPVDEIIVALDEVDAFSIFKSLKNKPQDAQLKA
ncbi:MAG: hypothetical protein KA802_11400 [Saprospiraceae bacterium]|nr:hypothetical protein [Saprospiraceae bacterium]